MRKNFGANPWFYPLPVLMVGTYNEDGSADVMNAAWGGLYSRDKVVLCLSGSHRTTANIKAKGAFTVAFADVAHVVEADYVGLVSANQEPEKMQKSGLHVTKSEFVDAPVVDEFPLALECTLVKVNEDGNIIGQIVNVSADESIVGEDGKIEPEKWQAISFDPVQNSYRRVAEKVGNAFQDGAKLK